MKCLYWLQEIFLLRLVGQWQMIIKNWQFHDVESHFCEIVKCAILDGPQSISLHDESVVVMSKEQYDFLGKQYPSFVEFMQRSPLVGVNLDLKRHFSTKREDEI